MSENNKLLSAAQPVSDETPDARPQEAGKAPACECLMRPALEGTIEGAELRVEVERQRQIIARLAGCGFTEIHPRYVMVQVERDEWAALQADVAEPSPALAAVLRPVVEGSVQPQNTAPTETSGAADRAFPFSEKEDGNV